MRENEGKYNEAEKKILNLSEDFLVFLDEVGERHLHELSAYTDPSYFPVHTVHAVIISKGVYAGILLPGLNEIKQRYFQRDDFHFHCHPIRRKAGIYKIFLDQGLYEAFKRDILDLLEESSITIVSSSINKIKLRERVEMSKQKTGDEYDIGDIYLRNVEYVLERIGHFLSKRTARLIFETSGRKESKKIQGIVNDLKKDGSFYWGVERFEAINSELLFFTKEDNVNGLQIVDYCAYPFAKHCRDQNSDNELFKILMKYVHPGDYGIYGLKEWP